MKYIVRPRAWIDIEESMVYLRDHADEQTANRFADQTQQTIEFLTKQPGIGRPRPDLKPQGLRSWRVEGFEN